MARPAAAAAAAFYGRTLAVTLPITAQWFAMFAVLAYAVPHVACLDELVKERVRGMGGGGRPLVAVAGHSPPKPFPLSRTHAPVHV